MAGLLGLPSLKLAQPVKDAVRVLYGWTDNHTEGHLKDLRDPRFDVTPREAMVHTRFLVGYLPNPIPVTGSVSDFFISTDVLTSQSCPATGARL